MKSRLILIILLSALILPSPAAGDTTIQPAKKQWILNTLDGDQVNVGERLRTPRNRIMVFWATWCPYCKQLMPIVNELKRDYPDLEVLAFNVFDELQPQDYARQANWPFVHLLDGDAFARAHGVKGVPTLFVVDSQGKMVLDLREIDTATSLPGEATSNRARASHNAPLWNAGLRNALDKLTWEEHAKP